MKKNLKLLLLAALVCSILAGCSIEKKNTLETDPEGKYQLYYLNEGETALKDEAYSPEEETTEFLVKDLMQRLGKKEAPDGEVSLLPANVSINSYDVQEDLLVIDFSKEYSEMSKAREVLARAGIVQTLLQAPEIHRISFTVAGEPLKNSRNQEVGEMTSDTFVRYTGGSRENYRYDVFTLYFADESGKKLVKETRTVYYRRSLPKERVVLEQLAKGPMEEGHHATIPETVSVLNVITADQICYVNLNSAFLEENSEVSENIMLYSVVSSLVDSCGADKVQISVEGSTDDAFGDTLPLYKFYEKDESLIAQDIDES